jgi:hypothetical protein
VYFLAISENLFKITLSMGSCIWAYRYQLISLNKLYEAS